MAVKTNILFYNGYRYLKHKHSAHKIWWRCEKYKKSCKGWASQERNNITETKEHNHLPSENDITRLPDKNDTLINNSHERMLLLGKIIEHKNLLEEIIKSELITEVTRAELIIQ